MWLDLLVTAVDKIPGPKPRRTTLRDVKVMRELLEEYGCIPPSIEDGVLARLANAHGCSVATMSNSISRFRKYLADPSRYTPLGIR